MSDKKGEKRSRYDQQYEREEEKFIEVVPVDEEERKGEDYLLEEESPMDKLSVDEHSEDIIDRQVTFIDKGIVQEDLEDRQKLAQGGREEMEESLEEHHASSPDVTGGDLDID